MLQFPWLLPRTKELNIYSHSKDKKHFTELFSTYDRTSGIRSVQISTGSKSASGAYLIKWNGKNNKTTDPSCRNSNQTVQ
jgi:hypothetical protein